MFVRQPNNRIDEYRRLDAGLTATAGIEKNRFIVGVNYDLSLVKSKVIAGFGGPLGFSEYNRSLGLFIGYYLNKNLQAAGI